MKKHDSLLFFYKCVSRPHSIVPDSVSISSKFARLIVGYRYQEIRDSLFELVDPSYGPNVTKAWRPLPGAKEWLLERTLELPPFPRPDPTLPTDGPAEDTREVRVNLQGLLAAAASRPPVEGLTAPEHLSGCDIHQALLLSKQTHALSEWYGWGIDAALRRRDWGDFDVLVERYRTTYGAGRLYCIGPGLQLARKEMRRIWLAGQGYVDVDMANAQPEILNQLSNGSVPALARYCADREGQLAELMTHYGIDRTKAKLILLCLLFGAGPEGETIQSIVGTQPTAPLVAEFAKVPELLWDVIREEVPAAVTKYANKHSKARGSRLALTAQWHEARALQSCLAFHRGRGESVDLLMFDGYLVRAWVDDDDLLALSQHVEAETGLWLRFTAEPLP